MKNKAKIVILVIILILFCFILTLWINKVNSFKKYTCTITKIDGNTITGAFLELTKSSFNGNQKVIRDIYGNQISASKLNIGDTIYINNSIEGVNNVCKVTNIENDIIFVESPQLTYYSFIAKETLVKDDKGHIINISELKEGNRISIVSKKENITKDVIQTDVEGYPIYNFLNVSEVNIIEENITETEAIKNKNMIATKSAVIIRVNKDSLDVMGTENTTDILKIAYSNENNMNFKQGQEILIYFNGYRKLNSYAEINNVGKIEIIKDKSDILISQEVIKAIYNSQDNVEIDVNMLTNTGISIIIKDLNNLQYNYSNQYILFERNQKLTPNTQNENYFSLRRHVGS